jgi:poly-gamma-glutamate synthesis protein (capsule biosynthesis protein)
VLCALAAAAFGADAAATRTEDAAPRFVFAGDILLGREVATQIDRTGKGPWGGGDPATASATLAFANFEGAVGDAKDCDAKAAARRLCFAVAESSLKHLAEAGFDAVSLANNHAADLGEAGLERSADALGRAGVTGVTEREGPFFFPFGDGTLAVVAVNRIAGRDGKVTALPSPELAQRLALATALAATTVVSIHWGAELADWPTDSQRSDAAWLVAHGADVVVGHHPHVEQGVECVGGRPVYWSLGNHVFDQKYEATKHGLLASCARRGGELRCGGLRTTTPRGSAFPGAAVEAPEVASALAPCPAPLRSPATVAGYALAPRGDGGHASQAALSLVASRDGKAAFRTRATSLLRLTKARFRDEQSRTSREYLVTLERHWSSIDREDAPRPYVYELTPRGAVARWRGSALAWPLVDAVVLEQDTGDDRLCALHRKDAFLVLGQAPAGYRAQAYRWNGFGFSGDESPAVALSCRRAWAEYLEGDGGGDGGAGTEM